MNDRDSADRAPTHSATPDRRHRRARPRRPLRALRRALRPRDAHPGAAPSSRPPSATPGPTRPSGRELDGLLRDYAGRPSPVTECARLSELLGVRVLLKREDLNHTGSHKINNVLGQALLAQRMGKHRLIAETGAGQHGVATATAAALLGQECVVYMGEVDMERQALNVFRMRLLGAEVRPASTGSRTLKDAVNEAMRDWVASVETTHYCLGSVMGPHPYPWMVREFHRVIGDEAREQCRALLGGADPDVVVACVGGGSNAAGIFSGFGEHRRHRAVGRRAGRRRRRRAGACPGIVHGMKSFLMQDEWGQVMRGAVDLGRPRLPGRRARARPPGRHRPGPLRAGHRRRGARRLRHAVAHRGHHPGPRVGPRARPGHPGTATSWPARPCWST